MKIIAFYLPQFHEVPENNEWWGNGFTEWDNVKKARPLFEGHYQPHIPLDGNYYDLSDDTAMKWQVNLAKKYGVYGFCFYHYWFNGKLMLEKPLNQYLKNKELNLPFCIYWANESWTRRWVANEGEILLKQEYGTIEMWEKHFEFLLPFFKDERYIKTNGKPLLIIHMGEYLPSGMPECWESLAIKAGLPGIDIAYRRSSHSNYPNDENVSHIIDVQPSVATSANRGRLSSLAYKLGNYAIHKFGIRLRKSLKQTHTVIDFSKVWDAILSGNPLDERNIPGAYVGWDNSPRYGKRARIHINNTPEVFESYLTKQIVRARDVYNKDMLFLFAWNEWAEGAHLEPDERFGYGYLEAVRNALNATSEFPED